MPHRRASHAIQLMAHQVGLASAPGGVLDRRFLRAVFLKPDSAVLFLTQAFTSAGASDRADRSTFRRNSGGCELHPDPPVLQTGTIGSAYVAGSALECSCRSPTNEPCQITGCITLQLASHQTSRRRCGHSRKRPHAWCASTPIQPVRRRRPAEADLHLTRLHFLGGSSALSRSKPWASTDKHMSLELANSANSLAAIDGERPGLLPPSRALQGLQRVRSGSSYC